MGSVHTPGKGYLVGLTTTGGMFVFGGQRPEPFYEAPLSGDRPLHFVSPQLVPSGFDRDHSIIPADAFSAYVGRLRSHLEAMGGKISANHLRQAATEEVNEEVEYDAMNPEEREAREAVIGIFCMMHNARPIDASCPVEKRMRRKLTDILDEPLKGYDTGYDMGTPWLRIIYPKLDGGNVWPEGRHDLGVSSYLPMAQLILDAYIAREMGLELVTNSKTGKLLPKAQCLLGIIESEDLVRYFSDEG